MTRTLLVATFAAAAGVSGCAGISPSFDMNVTAHSRAPERRATTYAIRSTSTNADSAILGRAAAIVAGALKRAGMNAAPSAANADLDITIEFAMGDSEKVRELEAEPILVNVRQPSTTTTVQTGTARDGTPIYSTVTTPGQVTQEYAGERQVCVTTTVYEKRLRVAARPGRLASGGDLAPEVWNVTVSTTDPWRDLQKYVPLLASTAANYINQDSGGPVAVTVGPNGRPKGAPADASLKQRTRC